MSAETYPLGELIVILGDGQLGRMLAMTAARLGYRVIIVGPQGRESPSGQVAYAAYAWGANGELTDELRTIIRTCRACLIEWENVPLALVEDLEAGGTHVYPGSKVLRTSQDRLLEKQLARRLGIPIGRYWNVEMGAGANYPEFLMDTSFLKGRSGGYDGLNRKVILAGDSIKDAWLQLNSQPCILEEAVQFTCEFSVIVFRNNAGEMITYGPFENHHKNSILNVTLYPARPKLSESALNRAIDSCIESARIIAEHLGLVGILTTEHFILEDGTAFFNEMAPRNHNSGHLTMDCFDTSQFEQYVRAALDLPWGSRHVHHAGRMTNILGDEIYTLPQLLARDVVVHVYGKLQARAGRKMGHYTERLPLLMD